MSFTAPPASETSPRPRLSIGISTFNRAAFLGATLDTIVPQLNHACELLIVDNASTDDTRRVVEEYMRRHGAIRYVRAETNLGIDRNFDRVVEQSRGEYCWLMPDDDWINPGGVRAVLDALDHHPSQVFVNFEFRDTTMRQVLQTRCLDFYADRTYGAWELDRLFYELRDFVRYIGAFVVNRTLWLERDRELYVGSLFSFVGMVFQQRLPGPTYVIAKPYVSYRCGNTHSWSSNGMELIFAKWPSLVASLPVSEAAKRKVHSAYPWKHAYELLVRRGAGQYSLQQYKLWLRPQLRRARDRLLPFIAAILPGALVNLLLLLRFLGRDADRMRQLEILQLLMLKRSPHHFSHWKRKRSPTRPTESATAHPSGQSVQP